MNRVEFHLFIKISAIKNFIYNNIRIITYNIFCYFLGVKNVFCAKTWNNVLSFVMFVVFVGLGELNASSHNNQSLQISNNNNSNDETIQKVKLDKVTATADKELDLPETSGRNVIVIDKQDLQDKGYTNLEQALEHQPAITFTPGPNGQKQIDIRG